MSNVVSCCRSVCISAALLGGFSTVHAADLSPAVQWHQIGDAPGFPGLRQELARIVARRGSRIATFCTVLRDSGDRDPIAYALWPQRHLLYRWQATREAALGDATLLHHMPLDLRRDLVRTQADGLSTYKVTAAWADDVETQCRMHGEQMTIERSGR